MFKAISHFDVLLGRQVTRTELADQIKANDAARHDPANRGSSLVTLGFVAASALMTTVFMQRVDHKPAAYDYVCHVAATEDPIRSISKPFDFMHYVP